MTKTVQCQGADGREGRPHTPTVSVVVVQSHVLQGRTGKWKAQGTTAAVIIASLQQPNAQSPV